MNGRWMAVCSNGWTEREVGLLCRKRGHSSYGDILFITCSYNRYSSLFVSSSAGAEIKVFIHEEYPCSTAGWLNNRIWGLLL